jgi:hypothetical protein
VVGTKLRAKPQMIRGGRVGIDNIGGGHRGGKVDKNPEWQIDKRDV